MVRVVRQMFFSEWRIRLTWPPGRCPIRGGRRYHARGPAGGRKLAQQTSAAGALLAPSSVAGVGRPVVYGFSKLDRASHPPRLTLPHQGGREPDRPDGATICVEDISYCQVVSVD
jgi:hypothetical protein